MYQEIHDRLLSGQGRTCEMLRSRIALFCTWVELQGYDDLETAAADLLAYGEWLIGWGFPAKVAAMHIAAIRKRMEAL